MLCIIVLVDTLVELIFWNIISVFCFCAFVSHTKFISKSELGHLYRRQFTEIGIFYCPEGTGWCSGFLLRLCIVKYGLPVHHMSAALSSSDEQWDINMINK